MTIVPPLPQDASADVMAGTSSVEEEPPAVGVHVEARALRAWVVPGRDSARGMMVRRMSDLVRVVIVGV